MADADGRKCSSEWPTKATKRSGGTYFEGRGFFGGFTSPRTSTLILALTMRFSPHTEKRKLTSVQINQSGEESMV